MIQTENNEYLPNSSEYSRLASHCLIENYPAWFERRRQLSIWLKLTEFLNLPVDQNDLVRKELEVYRLQTQCLKLVERLPVSIGPG